MKAEVATMSNLLHPGLILICAGLVTFWLPKNLRRCMMLIGPLAALYAAFQLPAGADCSMDFIYGYHLHYLVTDKLSIIFTMIFSIMALIGCIYANHNESRMEAMCSMAYAGGAIGVTLAGDWLTLIFFWESLAVTSLFLIWCSHTPTSRRAGFRYLLVHLLGGNLLLAGIFLKISAGDVMVGNLVSAPHDYAFWLILLGVAVNEAIPPLNAWLVDA